MSAVAPAAAQLAPAGPPVIVTQGESTVKRAPDRALLSVSAETRDPKAAEARRRNAETMTSVQSALKAAGVAADAIRTVCFSLSPEMDWVNGRSTMKGYSCATRSRCAWTISTSSATSWMR